MNGEQQPDADTGSGVEEVELSWEDYLEDTGSTAVPYGFFKHVDTRLQNGFAPGMKLEMAVKADPEAYWVATVIIACEQLLLLRYDGYGEDRKADFWCDIRKTGLYPIGWCEQNKKTLEAPEGIRDKVSDWAAFLRQTLVGACSPPVPLLEGLRNGRNPLDLIAPGSRLECQAFQDSVSTWIVTVVENIGGRLKLRYEGLDSTDHLEPWLYYLDPFLHHIGWATQQGYELQPPLAIRHLKPEAEWQKILAKVREEEKEPLPSYLFKDKQVIGTHAFSVNMKLEAVDPWSPFGISPATVTKVFDEKYFLVEMDDLRPESHTRRSFVCHVNSPGIFPVQWSLKNGFHLSPPPGYPSQDFDWADYLKQCSAEAAPQRCFPASVSEHAFKANMKLEAVNPLHPEEVCIATVTAVRGAYLWLQLEGSKKPIPECIVSVESMDIFPLGWCETNGHPLSIPRRARVYKQRKIAVVQPEKQLSSSRAVHEGLKNRGLNPADSVRINGKYCCPKIYFNHRCFSGPYLNKGRIAELPRCVGPGNCVLVLREVLTLLINAAYKPSRVLRELQLDKDSVWHGCGEVLKAKYKGKSYRATVEIVKTADRVTEFCRQTCIKLECCPNLFGPRMVLDKCSENCSVLTKTKYTHYYGKKKNKRIGRPPGGHSNIASVLKKASKRRKRRKNVFVHKKKHSSTSVDNTPVGSPQASGGEEEDDGDEGDDDSLSEGSLSEPHDEVQEQWEPSKKLGPSSLNQSELSKTLPSDKETRKREPGTKQPCTRESGTKQPCTKEPCTRAPSTKELCTRAPSTKEPSTKEPSTKEPSTKEPCTKEPCTMEPCTRAPSTKEPFTKEPCTKEPCTMEPCTKEPCTKEPCTKEPCTRAPSTREPPPCTREPPPCTREPPPCTREPPPCTREPPPCTREPPPCSREPPPCTREPPPCAREPPCTVSHSDEENKPPSPKEIRIEVAERLHLDSNPLKWSVADVVRFIRSTDCAPLARIFLDQEIDGQALLLLTLPTVQECMDLKLGPAIKLCHHIERIKFAFYEQFAN